jgi:hypothetical protein
MHMGTNWLLVVGAYSNNSSHQNKSRHQHVSGNLETAAKNGKHPSNLWNSGWDIGKNQAFASYL